jgi:heme/copper-type cytochrome/quinol oxidase subunit 1
MKLDEMHGNWHFWTLSIGFQVTLPVQYWAGVARTPPRRAANYPLLPGSVTS